MVHGDMGVCAPGDPTFDKLGAQPVLFPPSPLTKGPCRDESSTASCARSWEAGHTACHPGVPGGPTLPAVHTPSLGLMMALERTPTRSLFFALEFPGLMILRFHSLQVLRTFPMNILILRFCDSQSQCSAQFAPPPRAVSHLTVC